MPQQYDTESSTHRQLRNLVADKLRSAILNSEIRPGEWLRQERLAQEYGVSQMPVREALKELTAEGLVEHIPYRGVRVIEFSSDDISDLYACRSFMEGMAARSAAANITSDELAELKVLHAQMKARLEAKVLSEYSELNRRFHRLIFSASRRAYLTRTLNQMWDTFPSMLWGNFARTAGKPLPQRDLADIDEHEALIAALEKRDGETAERVARRHIEESGQHLVVALHGEEA
jgi:DNA-binding GntR family transcriptional regulator